MKTHKKKQFKYKNKNYKFKSPLIITTHTFLCYDNKTIKSELYVPLIMDGYTSDEFKDQDKEVTKYLNYIFGDIILKNPKELSVEDNIFRKKWLDLLKD